MPDEPCAGQMQPGPALDALVAREVRGWVTHPRNNHMWCSVSDDGNYVLERDAKDWFPSTDIRAAMEVAEKFFVYLFHKQGPSRYDATVGDLDALHSATTPTLPHAICLASLKAKENGDVE